MSAAHASSPAAMNCQAGASLSLSRSPHPTRTEPLSILFPRGNGARDAPSLCRYNQLVVKRAAVFVLVVSLLFCSSLRAQDATVSGRTAVGRIVVGHTMVVIPFENASPTPGLEWLGESFPVAFHEQLNSPVLYVASRDERLRAYDRQGIPAGVHAARATLYRLAEQMDVDYAGLGSASSHPHRLLCAEGQVHSQRCSRSPGRPRKLHTRHARHYCRRKSAALSRSRPA